MQFILEYWAQWAFALMGGAVLAAIPKIKALWQAVLALLHDRIYTECYHFLSLGHITPDGLRNLTYLYKTYHTMGGNGTGTELYNRAKHCPSVTDTLTQARPRREKGHLMNAHITTPRTVSATTIARTAVLALALINQILSAMGKPLLPIESAQLEQLISTGFTTVSALVNWWFNNSFTKEAIQADAEFERLRKSVK